MRRFRMFLVAFFCVFVLVFIGASPQSFTQSEVRADNSGYNISYNPYYGMYQADFYGSSRDMLCFCIIDLYCNYGGGGIINLHDDILVTSHIDIVDGHFLVLGNGHSLIYSGPTYILVAQDNIFKVSGNADVSFQGVTFNGQGLCYSSIGVPGSILELLSGNPKLTLNECTICNSRNFTAFDRTKPLGGGTGINAWYGTLICNNTTFYNISGAAIYESEGGNPYHNGRCNVTLNNCSSHDVSSLFSSGDSVGCSHSLIINGGNYKCGGSSDYITYCVGIDLGNVLTDNICASINNAYISCDGGIGINNRGTMSINNSDISADYIFSVVNNFNNMTIGDTKIHDSGVGLYNNATLNFVSGSIYNNSGFGIVNDGNIIQSGGNIHSNSGDTLEGKIGGIYQNGSYYIKDKARIGSNNSVFLVGQHVLDIDYKYMDMDSKSTLSNYSPIVITLDLGERYVGRKLINVVNSNGTVDKYTSLVIPAFTELKFNNNKTIFNGVKNSASIRAGNNIYNCDNQSLYLSGRYYLYYDNSFDGYNRTKVNYSRAYDEFFWMENVDIDFSTNSYDVLCDGINVTNSFVLKSFVMDNELYQVKNTHFTDREKWVNNRTCKGVFDVRFNMLFDGNGGNTKEGMADVIEYNIDNTFSFPEYIFIRDKEKANRHSLINEEDVECEYEYSQQGWNMRRDGTYSDLDTIKANTDISAINNNLTDYLLDALEKDSAILKEGFATIEYFSVWDEYPIIDNIDIAIPVEYVDSIDEAYIINKAKVESRDREDNENVIIGIEDFEKSELERLEIGESLTLNVTSKDMVGNVTTMPLTIRVSSDKPIKRRTVLRYVDLDNIHSKEADGGLMENSKWFSLLV